MSKKDSDPKYSYDVDANTWDAELSSDKLLQMITEVEKLGNQDSKVFWSLLSTLSQFSVSVLTYIESLAFNQPMGESLVADWKSKKRTFSIYFCKRIRRWFFNN